MRSLQLTSERADGESMSGLLRRENSEKANLIDLTLGAEPIRQYKLSDSSIDIHVHAHQLV